MTAKDWQERMASVKEYAEEKASEQNVKLEEKAELLDYMMGEGRGQK